MRIRNATIEDEAAIIALLQKLLIPGGEVKEGWNDEAMVIRRVIENPDFGSILVAEEDGEIAGVTTLSYPIAIRCYGRYACLEENIVDEKFRGKGVGGKLLKAALAEATEKGCDEFQVNGPSEFGYPMYMRYGLTDEGKKHIKAKLPLISND